MNQPPDLDDAEFMAPHRTALGPLWRFVAYGCSVMIIGFIMLCLLALYESRQPKSSKEVLMIIPGSTWLMMWLAGGVLLSLWNGRDRFRLAEKVVLGVLGLIGVGAYPLLAWLKF